MYSLQYDTTMKTREQKEVNMTKKKLVYLWSNKIARSSNGKLYLIIIIMNLL